MPHTSAGSSATRTSRSAPSSAAVRRAALPLIVLNNSGTVGLAERAEQQFTSGGWRVSATEDNYVNRILSTAAYYDPAVPMAKPVALLLQQQFPAIKRVVPKFEGLPAGPIVVVLTTDYSID
jgi:hypothetical protein